MIAISLTLGADSMSAGFQGSGSPVLSVSESTSVLLQTPCGAETFAEIIVYGSLSIATTGECVTAQLQADRFVLGPSGIIRLADGLDAASRGKFQLACQARPQAVVGLNGGAATSLYLAARTIILHGTIHLGNGGHGESVDARACQRLDVSVRGGDGGAASMLNFNAALLVDDAVREGGHGGDGGDAVVQRSNEGGGQDDWDYGTNGTVAVHPDGGWANAQGRTLSQSGLDGARGGNAWAHGGNGAPGPYGGIGGHGTATAGNGTNGQDVHESGMRGGDGGDGGNATALGGDGGAGTLPGNGGLALAFGGWGGRAGSSQPPSGDSGRGGNGGQGGSAYAYGGKAGDNLGGPVGATGGSAHAFGGDGGWAGNSLGVNGTGGQGGNGGATYSQAADGSNGTEYGGSGGQASADAGTGGRGGDGVAAAGHHGGRAPKPVATPGKGGKGALANGYDGNVSTSPGGNYPDGEISPPIPWQPHYSTTDTHASADSSIALEIVLMMIGVVYLGKHRRRNGG